MITKFLLRLILRIALRQNGIRSLYNELRNRFIEINPDTNPILIDRFLRNAFESSQCDTHAVKLLQEIGSSAIHMMNAQSIGHSIYNSDNGRYDDTDRKSPWADLCKNVDEYNKLKTSNL